MQRTLWFILFVTVLLFELYTEQQYIFIYYTIWTFTLETLYFGLFLFPNSIQKHLFETIFAPSIVVFVGFWTMIAPMCSEIPNNMLFVIVTHGLNAIAMVSEMKNISLRSIWKPIAYTIAYNLFLVVYVGAGGRSISGKLPYWYAQYDKPIGWVFAVVSVISVSIVHIVSAIYMWPQKHQTLAVLLVTPVTPFCTECLPTTVVWCKKTRVDQ